MLLGFRGKYFLYLAFDDNEKLVGLLNIRFDLTNELGTLYYRKATSMDSSGNRVYTSTSIANGSLDGKRITLTWSPASNGVYFKVYVDSSLKTSFTLTGISLNNPYLFIGNDCDVSSEYIVPLAIKDLVLLNYAISSYSVITNALKNIRVNTIAPGFFWTPLQPACWEKEKIPTLGADAPMKRAGETYEISPLFVYLGSDDSSYVTGQVIGVDGGLVV